MNDTEPRYVKVHTLANRFEADVITEALNEEGIPVMLRSFMETPYSGLFVPQKGWGRIMVPEEWVDRAKEIISGFVEKNETAGRASTDDRQIAAGLWDNLRRADPREVASRARAGYEDKENAYVVPFLNTAVLCHPDTEEIEILDGPADLSRLSEDSRLTVLVLQYLLHAKDEPPAGIRLRARDLIRGDGSFNYCMLPTEAFCDAFDEHPEILIETAERLGGERTEGEGLSLRFIFFPRIPLSIVFLKGDRTRKPSLEVLFDKTVTDHLGSAEPVPDLVSVFVDALLDAAAPSTGS